MTNINKEELSTINGGDSISGTLISAVNSGLKVLFDVGRSLGSSVRRNSENDLCPL